jgi:two-component system sensor histidine kinase QseC
MLVIFVLSLGASAMLGALEAPDRPDAGRRGIFEREPFQDGLVLAGFAVPALGLIWLVSFWSLRPLVRASAEARAVGPLDPAARISRAGLPAEIVPLVDAVNGALDRMAEAFAAERRFTENAAHELRTPLAVLGLRLQRARQSAAAPDWAAIEQDMAQMNRLVGQLLDLARKENAGRHAHGTFAAVNLSRVAREAAAMIFPLVEAQGRTLSIDVPDSLIVRGDAHDLREALSNLLENAALHGSGTIGLLGQARAGEAVLTVSDEGPGLPASLAATAFERFQKGSTSEGTGLGLSIVREVIRNHGGQIGFLGGAPCRVEVRLPLG